MHKTKFTNFNLPKLTISCKKYRPYSLLWSRPYSLNANLCGIFGPVDPKNEMIMKVQFLITHCTDNFTKELTYPRNLITEN